MIMGDSGRGQGKHYEQHRFQSQELAREDDSGWAVAPCLRSDQGQQLVRASDTPPRSAPLKRHSSDGLL